MRRKAVESSVLFISILKWLFLASCAGVLVGLSTTVFLKALGFSITAASGYRYYFLLLPAALFLSAIIVKYLAPDAEGHGPEKIIKPFTNIPARSSHEPLQFVPVFSSLFFIKVCGAGIFFGICSLLLIEVLRLFERMSHRMNVWPPLKGLLAVPSLSSSRSSSRPAISGSAWTPSSMHLREE